MIYSHIYKYAYFAPMKTGTCAIQNMLKWHYEGEFYPRSGSKHIMAQPKEFTDYFSFVSVRNPYTRVLSMYNFYAAKPWIYRHRDFSLAAVIRRLCPVFKELERNDIRIDKAIHQENLEDEFNNLPFVKSAISFSKVNVSPKFLIGMTQQHKELVQSIHRIDFKSYDYEIEDCPVPILETWEECLNKNPYESIPHVRRVSQFTYRPPKEVEDTAQLKQVVIPSKNHNPFWHDTQKRNSAMLL